MMRSATAAAVFALVLLAIAAPDHASQAADLTELSMEQLGDIEVTSVSKQPEPRGGAAAAIAVITNDDIRRSGALNIPDALRMAPGLHVARAGGDSWAVSSRGFANLNSGKLLVLMDGRSLYTPLFSGVFWDVQDTLLEDVDRIEVIRGPGAALWGANAMNGVINITTKTARDTQGVLLTGGGGTEERGFTGVRYGGRIGDDGAFYRFSATYFDRNGGFLRDARSNDSEQMGRFGFRSDWDATPKDAVTLQGDVYDGRAGQVTPNLTLAGVDGTPLPPPHGHTTDLAGGNLIGRWSHQLSDGSQATIQAYYDRTDRDDPSFRDTLDTFDLELEHRAALPRAQELSWGIAYRLMSDEFHSPFASLLPARSNDQLVSGFVQDQIALLDRTVRITLGSKLEHNDFSGFEVEPSARVAWTPATRHTVWAAVSRAVRTPTRIERDVFGQVDDATDDLSLRVHGNDRLQAEEMIAYELGYRVRPTSTVLFDLALFYNDYDRLVTFETEPTFPEGGRTIVPIRNGNGMHGETFGGEAAVDWTVAPRWKVSASYSALQLNLRANPKSTDRSSQDSDSSPKHQAQLRSMLDLPYGLELDGWLRWVDNLPADTTSSYWNLDVRLGWHPYDSLELSLVGQNLLRSHHGEFSGGTDVERGAYGKATWRFGR